MTKTHAVEFEGYPGEYVVRVSPVPVDDLFTVNDAMRRWNTREGMTELKASFAPFIETWPLEGEPSAETVGRLDVNLLLALVREWQAGVAEVPLPLPRTSSGGDPSDPPEDRSQ